MCARAHWRLAHVCAFARVCLRARLRACVLSWRRYTNARTHARKRVRKFVCACACVRVRAYVYGTPKLRNNPFSAHVGRLDESPSRHFGCRFGEER